jgi:D-amino-acid oxidase
MTYPRDAEITLVGCGVVGLSTAVVLARQGARVTVLHDPQFSLVSPVACALWLPTWMSGTMQTFTDDEEQVLTASWRAYSEIAEQYGRSAGFRRVTNREHLEVGDSPPPDWLTELLPTRSFTAIDPVVSLGDHRSNSLWVHDTLTIDMSFYLPWLKQTAVELNVQFDERYVQSLDDLTDADVVVNCSGLGSRKLCPDDINEKGVHRVHPVRGQLNFFTSPKLNALPSIGFGQYCLVPRVHDIGIGSLLRVVDPDTIEPQWCHEDGEELDAAMSALARLAEIEPEELTPTGRRVAGLRPSREGGIRLERDPHRKSLIHNYGHGGAGVTAAWGCAFEVLRILEG